MNQNVLKSIDFDDLPENLKSFKNTFMKDFPEKENLLIYYEYKGERIVINKSEDYNEMKDRISKGTINIIQKSNFKPNITFIREGNDSSFECNLNIIKVTMDEKIQKAKEKISILLKEKEEMIEKKKEEMRKEINSIATSNNKTKNIDIFCANYFEKKLTQRLNEELNISLFDGINLNYNNVRGELYGKKCSFCNENIDKIIYKNDIEKKESYFCRGCYEALKDFYPANFIKL